MEISRELLERYHNGKCTEQEIMQLEAWLQHGEADTSFPRFGDIEELESQSWKEMQRRISQSIPLPVKGYRKSKWNKWLQFAAAAMVILAVGTWFSYINHQVKPSNYITVQTAKGETKEITLPDGSIIHLKAASELTYPEEFTDSIRLVSFRGEGYFQIAKNTDRPFVIKTPKTLTQVMGTAFNLKDYQDERSAILNVTEGKVSFSDPDTGEKLILVKGQGASLFDGLLVSFEIEQAALAWRSGILNFDNLEFSHITKELERWFNIEVRVVNQGLLQERFTGEFNNPQLREVVSSLGFALGFSYKYQGQILTIY